MSGGGHLQRESLLRLRRCLLLLSRVSGGCLVKLHDLHPGDRCNVPCDMTLTCLEGQGPDLGLSCLPQLQRYAGSKNEHNGEMRPFSHYSQRGAKGITYRLSSYPTHYYDQKNCREN